MPLVVGASAIGCAQVVSVRGALHEVVETQVPNPSKLGGMVVNPMPRLWIKSLANLPLMGLPGSPHTDFQHDLLSGLHRHGRIDVKLGLQLPESHGLAIPMNAVDDKGFEVRTCGSPPCKTVKSMVASPCMVWPQ